jgi:hypothetical protein
VRVLGKRGERRLVLSLCDKEGNPLFEHTIPESELRWHN